MSKFGKVLIIGAVILMLTVSPVFSSPFELDLSELADAIDTLSGTMATALPFYSTIGLNWSDAYIGQLLSFPPHFGVGVTMGVTTMGKDLSAFDPILNFLGTDVSMKDIAGGFSLGAPLPAVMLEARIGGIFADFDVGIKFMNMSAFGLDKMVSGILSDVTFEYELIGMDVRYSLMPSASPLKVSVGGGFNFLKGGIGIGMEEAFEIEGIDITGKTSAGIMWETLVFEAKAHVSFPLFIITPYAGLGVSYGWSKAGFNVRGDIEVGDLGDLQEYLDNAGLIPDVSSTGVRAYQEFSGFNFRIYGGFSLNLFVIRLDLTGMYNLMDGSLGASVGVRFQL